MSQASETSRGVGVTMDQKEGVLLLWLYCGSGKVKKKERKEIKNRGRKTQEIVETLAARVDRGLFDVYIHMSGSAGKGTNVSHENHSVILGWGVRLKEKEKKKVRWSVMRLSLSTNIVRSRKRDIEEIVQILIDVLGLNVWVPWTFKGSE